MTCVMRASLKNASINLLCKNLIKEADKLLKSDPSAEQAVVVLTAKGSIFSFANHNVMSGSVEDEIAFARALAENDDTEIRYMVCMWDDATPDVPSCHLRNLLAELNPANQNIEILLKSSEGFLVKSLKVLGRSYMNIEIYPLDRAVIDGASIYLGMEQAAVEAAIGKGEPAGNRYYYYNNEMAIDYSDGKVEFIEFLGGIDGIVHPWIYGVSAFDTHADELINILEQKNDGEVDDSEQGYSVAFLNISVGVYRELRPSDVEEMIEEIKADGISADNNEDVQKEMRKANHWSTIGIGAAGYYQK